MMDRRYWRKSSLATTLLFILFFVGCSFTDATLDKKIVVDDDYAGLAKPARSLETLSSSEKYAFSPSSSSSNGGDLVHKHHQKDLKKTTTSGLNSVVKDRKKKEAMKELLVVGEEKDSSSSSASPSLAHQQQLEKNELLFKKALIAAKKNLADATAEEGKNKVINETLQQKSSSSSSTTTTPSSSSSSFLSVIDGGENKIKGLRHEKTSHEDNHRITREHLVLEHENIMQASKNLEPFGASLGSANNFGSNWNHAGCSDDGWTKEDGGKIGCSSCGTFGKLLGGFELLGKDAIIKKTFKKLPEHTSMSVSISFVKIDSWDNERYFVYADSKLVYSSSSLIYYGGRQQCGSGNSNWNEEINKVTFEMGHVSDSVEFRISTDLNEGTGEWFGLQSFTFKTENKLQYSDDFNHPDCDANGWTKTNGGSVGCSRCGYLGYMLGGYNLLAVNDGLTKTYSNLPEHNSMSVELDFMKIDSWDWERFYVFADNELVYASDPLVYSQGSAICGQGHQNWNENRVRVKFVTGHSASELTLKITTSLDGTGTDESWGLQRLTFTLSKATVFNQNFNTPARGSICNSGGWTKSNGATLECSTCGSLGSMIGGYNMLAVNDHIKKTYSNLPKHASMIVNLSFMKIDSWDYERFYVYADEKLVFASDTIMYAEGSAKCGQGHANWNENIYRVSFPVPEHSNADITFKITTNLNGGGTDESWGMQEFIVMLSDTPIYGDNFNSGNCKAEGWTKANEQVVPCSSCGSLGYFLGGYNLLAVNDALTKTYSNLPEHNSMSVELDFMKIDSWDWERFYVFADDELVYASDPLVYSQGSAICGQGHQNWNENRVQVKFSVPHSNSIVKFKITTDLNGGGTDESWGVQRIMFTLSDDVLLFENFNNPEKCDENGWTKSDGTAIGCSTCGSLGSMIGGFNKLAKNDVIKKTFVNLPVHSQLHATLDFVKIDSWDAEKFFVYADEDLVYESERLWYHHGSQKCGRGHENWDENIVHVEFNFIHSKPSVEFRITTNLNEAGDNEAWGIQKFTVAVKNDLRIGDDFNSYCFHNGWLDRGNPVLCTSCGGFGSVLGGFNVLGSGAELTKTYRDLPPHISMQISFDFIKIDSCDGERFYLYVDDVLVYESSPLWYYQGSRQCGQGHDNWNEETFKVDLFLPHGKNEAKFRITTNLNNVASDESWGMRNFWIELESPSPPRLSIGNPAERVTDREFDFRIQVQDDGCSNKENCFEDLTMRQENTERGLRCEAVVASVDEPSCDRDSATDFLPCLHWDNFYDDKKVGQFKKYLSLNDKELELKAGTYSIQYNCFYKYKYYDEPVPGSISGWNDLHSFTVIPGCSEWLPELVSAEGDLSTIARLFLLSTPEFLSASCDSIDVAKENAFRKYDVSPLDGKLSPDELTQAFLTHDVDFEYLSKLQSNQFFIKGGIMLSDVMMSPSFPIDCQPVEQSTDIFMTSINYPTIESRKKECESMKQIVDVKWDYNKFPKDGDFQCIYADGRFYKKIRSEGGNYATRIKDERPFMGVGPQAVKMTTLLTFDSDLKNVLDGVGPDKVSGISSFPCGDGIACIKRSISAQPSGTYTLSNQPPMASSAVMTWIYLHDLNAFEKTSGKIWSGGEEKYEKYFRINSAKKLEAGFYGIRVEGNKTLTVEKYHHVAMVVNKEFGLTLFIDSEIVAFEPIIDNLKLDFPQVSSTVQVCDAAAIYDDFRIFTGTLTNLHVKSIFECGRSEACTKLAFAKPQSRRTYCILPNFASGSSVGFVPPCATGLYYNGAAIDLQAIPDQKGVLFSFRDTALGEIGYEVLRRRLDSNAKPMGKFEAVVLIDSALDLCATVFRSITFFDDAAIKISGISWEYSIRTKYDELTINSDPVLFTTPWFSRLETFIESGNTGIPVPFTRVCVRLMAQKPDYKSGIEDLVPLSEPRNLAANMYAWHSEQGNITKRSTAYTVTDQFADTYTELHGGEWVNITLSVFSSIKSINVCTVDKDAPEFDVRVLDYSYPDDKGDKGSKCILLLHEFDNNVSLSSLDSTTCQTYVCAGTDINSYKGQTVTVKSLQKVSRHIKLAEVEVMGVAVQCPFSGFTDIDGHVDVDLFEPLGQLPKNMQAAVIAHKTDVYDPVNVVLFTASAAEIPSYLLAALRIDEEEYINNFNFNETIDLTIDFMNTDNRTQSISRDELISYISKRLVYADSRIIIPHIVWDTIDIDGDNALNSTEVYNVVQALNKRLITAIPWVIYPVLETKYLSQFRSNDINNDKNVIFSILPTSNSTLPFLQESWQNWYDAKTLDTDFSLDTITEISEKTGLGYMGISDPPESEPYAIPFASPVNVMFDLTLEKDEQLLFADLTHGLLPEMFKSPVKVEATKRLPDVKHIFNQDSTENVRPITHLGVAGEDIVDNTAIQVSGMVRFPGDKTQGYVCGLQFAEILAFKGKKCTSDEVDVCTELGYKYETAPEKHSADELGQFDISLTPGETWMFVARYDGHEICYGGDKLNVQECEVLNVTTTMLHGIEYSQNVYIELENVDGSENIVFFDVTKREVDIGLYAGACGLPYKGYKLLVIPANGCGSSLTINGDDIHANWDLVDTDNTSDTRRYWKFAAMDYYIQLESSPDVSSLTGDKILGENEGASCKPPGANIMQFFRDRNTLVQTLLLLDREQADVKYNYHGWFCALPKFGRTEASATTPFTFIRKDELCVGNNATAKDLTFMHMLGTSNLEYSDLSASDVSKDKFVSLKIMEPHMISPGEITYCSLFAVTVNDEPTKLGVSIQVKQDIEPRGSNKCHPNNEPSPECVFTDVNATDGLVQFRDDSTSPVSSFKITSAGSMPNLVKPYRRTFLARIERNDGWSITMLDIERELVTLASKIRGSDGDPSQRYMSDTKFYATAPIRGLVYTVVHDPPGGNSYASISQGTHLDMEMSLATTRAAARTDYSADEDESDVEFEIDLGADFGGAYANADLLPESNMLKFMQSTKSKVDTEGPTVQASSTATNAWDFHITLDRTIESSQDPGLPGRPGDVILGGGFEIVYVRTDTVDIRTNCLTVIQEVQWLPRKPTTYVVQVFTIESRAIPELQELVKVAQNETSIMTDGEMGEKSNSEVKAIWMGRLEQTIEDWRRTLEWCSPDFNPEGFNLLSKAQQKENMMKIQSRYDNIIAALNSDESVSGRLMKAKIDEMFGTYSGDDSKSDHTAAQDWKDLVDIWDSISSESMPIEEVPGIRRTDKFKDMDGYAASKAASGAGSALAGIFKLISGIDIDRILMMKDSIQNPNPQGYMDDIALKNIVRGEEVASQNECGQWDLRCRLDNLQDDLKGVAKKYKKDAIQASIALSRGENVDHISFDELAERLKKEGKSLAPEELAKALSWEEEDGEESEVPMWVADDSRFLETYGPIDAESTGKNAFTSVDNKGDGLFSRGMSNVAQEDALLSSGMDIDTRFYEGDQASALADASMFGTKAPFRFGRSKADPGYSPVPAGKPQDIYLTFSGGGHAIEFVNSISEAIDGTSFSWIFDAAAKVDSDIEMFYDLAFISDTMNQKNSYSKSGAIEHVMAWTKYGDLSTKYSLGDSDPFDKFVIQVSTDKRFGTPIFKTVGGASKCPGEPNTMWRENGISVTTKWSPGVNNKFIPPDQSALFDILITNESPYRETVGYGLVLTSGEYYHGPAGGNMLDLSFTVNNDRLSGFGKLLSLPQVSSTDDSGNLIHSILSLRIDRGAFAHEYKSIGINLVSECEYNMDSLYRDPISADAFLDTFKWERTCPQVVWDPTTVNRFLFYTMTKETSSYVNMTVMNPDPLNLWTVDMGAENGVKDHLVHPNVEFVRVQWREKNQGEWINAWEMIGDDANIWKRSVQDADVQCNSARGEGCSLQWNMQRQYFLNGLKDGEWELRAKVFCSGYDSFATSDIRGSVTEENLSITVDVTPPVALDTSVLFNTFKIDYSEKIQCPQIQVDNMVYASKRVSNCLGIPLSNGGEEVSAEDLYFHYKFTCLLGAHGGALMVQFPDISSSGIYEFTVNADKKAMLIADVGNNEAATQSFKVAIGCNSTHGQSAKLGGKSKVTTPKHIIAGLGAAAFNNDENASVSSRAKSFVINLFGQSGNSQIGGAIILGFVVVVAALSFFAIRILKTDKIKFYTSNSSINYEDGHNNASEKLIMKANDAQVNFTYGAVL